MKATPRGQDGYSPILAHYQRALISKVLRATIPARVLLIAPPGSGKTVTAMALVAKVAEARERYRILVIGPKAWGAMFQHGLAQSLPGGTVAVVTPAVFRELEEGAQSGQPMWPDRFAAVFALDTARQANVLAQLSSVTWNLVVVEEVDLSAALRSTLLKTVLANGAFERVLVTTSELEGVPPLVKNIQRVTWTDKDLVNAERRADQTFIPFHRSSEEVVLLQGVVALANELASTPAGLLARDRLLRQAASSPVALEVTLRQWRKSLAHRKSESTLRISSRIAKRSAKVEPETASDVDVSSFETRGLWRPGSDPLPRLEELLNRIEILSRDSKREALEHLLDRLAGERASERNFVCVLCWSAATVAYLHTSIADRGIKARSVTSVSSWRDLRSELEGLASQGGVLLVTSPIFNFLQLGDVQTFIYFDAPSRAETLAGSLQAPTAERFILVDKSEVLPRIL